MARSKEKVRNMTAAELGLTPPVPQKVWLVTDEFNREVVVYVCKHRERATSIAASAIHDYCEAGKISDEEDEELQQEVELLPPAGGTVIYDELEGCSVSIEELEIDMETE